LPEHRPAERADGRVGAEHVPERFPHREANADVKRIEVDRGGGRARGEELLPRARARASAGDAAQQEWQGALAVEEAPVVRNRDGPAGKYRVTRRAGPHQAAEARARAEREGARLAESPVERGAHGPSLDAHVLRPLEREVRAEDPVRRAHMKA